MSLTAKDRDAIRQQIAHERRQQRERFAAQGDDIVGRSSRRRLGLNLADAEFDLVLHRAYLRWENVGTDTLIDRKR